MLQTTTHSSSQPLPLNTALVTSLYLRNHYLTYIMVNNTLSHSHLPRHDLQDPSTSGQRHQATPFRHEATPSSLGGTGVASMLHNGAIALPVGTLFGGEHTAAPNSIPVINMQNNHGPAAADGDLVWFCSECYDGPISYWQAICVQCSHQKCGSCRVEETG